MLRKRRLEGFRHSVFRSLKRPSGIPSRHVTALAEIARLMNLRGIRPPCLVDVPHRLEHLIVDVHQFLRFFQRIPVFRNHQTDRVSDHPRRVTLGDHNVPVLLDVADLVVRNIRRRQDADHARNLPGLRQVDLSDNRSRICRPYTGGIGHCGRIKAIDIASVFRIAIVDASIPASQGCPLLAPLQSLRLTFLLRPSNRYARIVFMSTGCARISPLAAGFSQFLRLAELTASSAVRDILLEPVGAVEILPYILDLDVIRVLAGSKDLLAHIHAEGSCPDTPVILLLRLIIDLFLAPKHLSCKTDALDDLPVSGTATEIAADRRLDLLIRRIRVLPEQPSCADDHPRCAEAALDRSADPERVDKRLLLEVCQSFHRDDFLSGGSLCLQDTGSRRFSVHQDHAGPAGALAAPILDRMKMKFVPKKTKHRRLLRCRYAFPVNRECILLSHGGSFLPIGQPTVLLFSCPAEIRTRHDRSLRKERSRS